MAGTYSLRHGRSVRHQKLWAELIASCWLATMCLLSVLSLSMHSVHLQSVQTNSLSPVVQSGDALVIRRANLLQVSPHDLVSFYTSAQPVQPLVGQVVLLDRSTGSLQVRVSNNQSMTVPAARLIGKADARVAGLGWLLDFWRSIPGLITLVYLPTLVIVGCEFERLGQTYSVPAYRLRRLAIQ